MLVLVLSVTFEAGAVGHRADDGPGDHEVGNLISSPLRVSDSPTSTTNEHAFVAWLERGASSQRIATKTSHGWLHCHQLSTSARNAAAAGGSGVSTRSCSRWPSTIYSISGLRLPRDWRKCETDCAPCCYTSAQNHHKG